MFGFVGLRRLGQGKLQLDEEIVKDDLGILAHDDVVRLTLQRNKELAGFQHNARIHGVAVQELLQLPSGLS